MTADVDTYSRPAEADGSLSEVSGGQSSTSDHPESGTRGTFSSALKRAGRGAAAGAAATAAMSTVMIAVRRVGLIDNLAPRAVTESALAHTTSGQQFAKPLSAIAHLAFGIGNGALFGLVSPLLPGPRVGKGTTFAALVLLASYEGWVPAAGILPPLHRQRTDRLTELVAGHAVYGVVLGRLTGVNAHEGEHAP